MVLKLWDQAGAAQGVNFWVDLARIWWWTALAAFRGVRCTLNNQLRTGTDKGNLTV